MRRGAAVAVACGLIGSGCAKEEGVLITVRTPDNPAFGPIATVELFLAGDPDPAASGRRFRKVLDPDAGDDLREVDGELNGYTIFLDGIPADVTLAAVAGYHDVPDEPSDQPAAIGWTAISFTPGELTSVEVTMRGNPTNQRNAVRWRGEPLPEPPQTFSCLGWTATVDGAQVEEAIVRVDDFDCDGTLPTDCSDPDQIFPTLPDDLPSQDLDGDGARTCDLCPSPSSGQVPCECNDDPASGGDAQNALLPEVCDGIDNDCDPSTFFASHVEDFRPCEITAGGSGCEVGTTGCQEQLGDVTADECKPATTVHMDPCAMAFSPCDDPDTCIVQTADPQRSISCQSGVAADGCGGQVALLDLIEALAPASLPIVCSAVIWGADDPLTGWSVRLIDTVNPVPVRVVRDLPCDSIAVELEGQSVDLDLFGAIVVVVDGETGERFTIPLSFQSYTGPCTTPQLTCAPPQ